MSDHSPDCEQSASNCYVAFVQWEFEDQLPKDLNKPHFDAMFELSKVDGVRMYPFIIWNGERIYLGRFMSDKRKILAAAEHMDWIQVVMNGSPPCFHLCQGGYFCGRAQQWYGHPDDHRFVSFADMLGKIAPTDGGSENSESAALVCAMGDLKYFW